MKKKSKKIISLLLVACMFLISIQAYASDLSEQNTDINNINDGSNTSIRPENYIERVDEGNLNIQTTLRAENASEVLLIQSKYPWNSSADEIVLNQLNIQYKKETVDSAVSEDFSNYKLIIVANDQTDDFYRTLSTIRTKLELFVMNGGTLLYGICDAGWGAGYSDLLIPGDIELGPVTYKYNNYIIDESHPIVTGILSDNIALKNSDLYNNYASHRYFKVSSLPYDTNIILNAGAEDMPTLVEYPIGNGIVIASALTWEHSYDNGGFGRKALDDLILYAYGVSVIVDAGNNKNLGYYDLVNGLTCLAGDPINVANGNFITNALDLKIEGENTINFIRYYNAMDSYDGVMGKNWRHNFEISLKVISDRRVRLAHGDGHTEDFIFGDDGLWYSTPGTYSKIISNFDGTYTIVLRDGTEYLFNADGLLTSIKEPYVDEIILFYDEGNQLIKVSQNDCYFNFAYENSKLKDISDHSGRNVQFNYANGFLCEINNVDGFKSGYDYDSNGRIVKIYDDKNQVIIYNIYDDKGRVIEQKMPYESRCTFSYDDQLNTTTYTDKNGVVTVYHKDEFNRVYRESYNNGDIIYDFDSNSLIKSVTDKNGNTTYYEYDERGNVLSETDALGYVSKYTYDLNNNITSYTTPGNETYFYTYDQNKNLVSETDPIGRTIEFVYDEAKHPVELKMANGKSILSEYDVYGNVTSITDGDGYRTEYKYDLLNRLVNEKKPDGNTIEYSYTPSGKTSNIKYQDGTSIYTEYDKLGNKTKVINEKGAIQLYSYNDIGKLSTFTDEAGNITRFEYDNMWNVSKIIYNDGSERSYYYDSSNNLTQITDEEGYTTSYTYDPNGNIINETDYQQNQTSYSYDALNRIISISDARANNTKYEYTQTGNLSKVIDPLGGEDTYVYDEASQLISWTNALGEKEEYFYDEVGNVKSVKDKNGNITQYEYNACGNITQVTLPDNSVVKATYNGNGNIESYTDANGSTTKYYYDNRGRLNKIVNPLGKTKLLSYNSTGKITEFADENGNITKYTYDALDQLTVVTDALGNKSEYVYDIKGNVTEIHQYQTVSDNTISKMKKGKGTSYNNSVTELVTYYTYNKKGLLTQEVSPSEKIKTYEYDGNGNLIRKVDEDMNTVLYEYDALNNLNKITYSENKIVDYSYNELNKVVSMTDWNGATNYELDALGRITKVTDYENRVTQYQWNSNDKKAGIVYPDGSSVTYNYNTRDQLETVVEADNLKTIYEYDRNGNNISTLYPNGAKTIQVYDALSRLTKKTDYDSTKRIISNYVYTYDNVGNKISVDRDKKLGLIEKLADESNGKTLYTYDALNRLASQQNSLGKKEKYFYDTLGNRIRKEIWTNSGLFVTVADYKYNVENQLTQVSGIMETVLGTLANSPIDFSYDDRGNLTGITRMIPSLFPPLWWTIPANAVIPWVESFV